MRLSAIPSSKILKKRVQIRPKFKRGFNTQEGHSALLECQLAHEKCPSSLPPKRAIQHSWSAARHMKSAHRHFSSADWPKSSTQPDDSWIEINLTLFDFLEIRTCSNSYLIIQLIFQSIPTSINRGVPLKIQHTFWPPPSPSLSSSSFQIFQFPLH